MDVPVDTKRARDSPVELRFLRQQAITDFQQLMNPKERVIFQLPDLW
jgi:hypothetical protein